MLMMAEQDFKSGLFVDNAIQMCRLLMLLLNGDCGGKHRMSDLWYCNNYGTAFKIAINWPIMSNC